MVQVSWDMETVLSTVDTNWEVDLEVESDGFLGSLSATEFSVAHLVHVVDVLFTVALSRLLVQLSKEVVHVIDRFLVELDSLDENLSIFQWVSTDIMGLLGLLLWFLSLGLVLVNLASLVGSPDDHVADDFSGMRSFFVLRGFFVNVNSDLIALETTVSNGSGVASVVGLHGSKEAWSVVSLGVDVVELDQGSFISNLVLGLANEPFLFGVLSVGEIPSDPRDFFVLGDFLFLFGLDHDLEAFVGDEVLSRGVWVVSLLSSDLSEHNWSFLEVMSELDSGPFVVSSSFSSFEPSSIW
jgi:hypothetical protein